MLFRLQLQNTYWALYTDHYCARCFFYWAYKVTHSLTSVANGLMLSVAAVVPLQLSDCDKCILYVLAQMIFLQFETVKTWGFDRVPWCRKDGATRQAADAESGQYDILGFIYRPFYFLAFTTVWYCTIKSWALYLTHYICKHWALYTDHFFAFSPLFLIFGLHMRTILCLMAGFFGIYM